MFPVTGRLKSTRSGCLLAEGAPPKALIYNKLGCVGRFGTSRAWYVVGSLGTGEEEYGASPWLGASSFLTFSPSGETLSCLSKVVTGQIVAGAVALALATAQSKAR